ncbi:CU044_5270 family protein [Streptomyces sp. NPDC101178]|uniref:CU044_5270 family protein n=1 Tax=Streptomyces sp. NPDC101178 TaxID=3366124 RepID=UPI003817E056
MYSPAGSPTARPTPDGADDADVIAQSLDEPELFAGLYDRHAPDIHRYVARRLGEGPADDITAETFLIAFRTRHRYDTAHRLARPWLYGIAANLIGRHRRTEVRALKALARTGHDPVAASWSDRAADYLERQKVPPEPRSDQRIHLREVDGASGNAQAVKELREAGVEVPPELSSDRWIPYDGKDAGNDVSDTDHRTARESYRIAAALPENPEALLAKLRATFPTGDGTDGGEEESEDAHSFRAVSVLLRSYPIPPDAMARIYRALATVKGVKVTHHLVEDAAGREVIAVVRQEHMEFTRTDLLIDPVDYGYAGTREVVVESYGTVGSDEEPAEQREPGDVLIDIARTHAAVVDAKGDTGDRGDRGDKP